MKERVTVVDIEALLPHACTPRDYLDLVSDPRIDQDGLHTLARSPYSFVRLAVAKDRRANPATLTELLAGEFSSGTVTTCFDLSLSTHRQIAASCSSS